MKPKPIQFRPNRVDMKIINDIKEATGMTTSSGAIRMALTAWVFYQNIAFFAGAVWNGDPEAKEAFEGIATRGEASQQITLGEDTEFWR